jgi:hypothetical protein
VKSRYFWYVAGALGLYFGYKWYVKQKQLPPDVPTYADNLGYKDPVSP